MKRVRLKVFEPTHSVAGTCFIVGWPDQLTLPDITAVLASIRTALEARGVEVDEVIFEENSRSRVK